MYFKRLSMRYLLSIICISLFILYYNTLKSFYERNFVFLTPQNIRPTKYPLYILPIQNYSKLWRIIFTNQRNIVHSETKNMLFPDGYKNITNLISEKGGNPIRSIIFSTFRSGSTFFGEILNSLPSNYYHYEPLFNYGNGQVRGKSNTTEALIRLKKLLNCDYNGMEPYLKYEKNYPYYLQYNIRLWKVCQKSRICRDPKFLTKFCTLFPLQSMKIVRLRLKNAESLLEDPNLNVKVVYLVRDPRGTIQSRQKEKWCTNKTDCGQRQLLCNDLVKDFYAAMSLHKKYPSRFKIIRYENFSLDVYNMTEKVLNFYGFSFHPIVKLYLMTHTAANKTTFRTYRNTKSQPTLWTKALSWNEVESIQKVCADAISLWGYKLANKLDYTSRKFYPLLENPFEN